MFAIKPRGLNDRVKAFPRAAADYVRPAAKKEGKDRDLQMKSTLLFQKSCLPHLAGTGPKPLRIGTDERVVIFETLVYSG